LANFQNLLRIIIHAALFRKRNFFRKGEISSVKSENFPQKGKSSALLLGEIDSLKGDERSLNVVRAVSELD